MAKKKIIRAEDITEKDVLSLYEVLHFLYDNPNNLDLPQELNKRLLRLVWYDFYHFLMDDPNENKQRGSLLFENWYNAKEGREFSDISELQDTSFEKKFEANSRNAILHARKDKPRMPKEYDYYRISSDTVPVLGLGFFRYKFKSKNNSFTDNEKRIFEKLTPHILLLYGIILHRAFESNTVQYFDSFSIICSRIADDFSLSKTELKLLPEILFGRSNEEIAEKTFVSIAAVKKNIKHIFKKTSTKNRIDFIGKFFTSPERINIK